MHYSARLVPTVRSPSVIPFDFAGVLDELQQYGHCSYAQRGADLHVIVGTKDPGGPGSTLSRVCESAGLRVGRT
eukprot:3233204-Rhodomonas_salina.1